MLLFIPYQLLGIDTDFLFIRSYVINAQSIKKYHAFISNKWKKTYAHVAVKINF